MGTPRACSRTRAVTFSVIARPIGDGDDVRAVDPLDVVGAELIEVAERPDARVVHQHVDPTVRGEHALHQHRALGGVGDVAGLDLDGGMLGGKGLQVAMAMQGLILWVPVEKLFMSEIGFTPASVGVMAAAYAAVVPLLEVPSGVLADRWSRNRIMVLAWKLLHDAVPSTIRAGVSSGAGTASWLLFLPLSLALGWLGRAHGVPQTGWILTGAAVLVGARSWCPPGSPGRHPASRMTRCRRRTWPARNWSSSSRTCSTASSPRGGGTAPRRTCGLRRVHRVRAPDPDHRRGPRRPADPARPGRLIGCIVDVARNR